MREKPKPGSPLLGSPFSVATYSGQGMSHHVCRYKATPALNLSPPTVLADALRTRTREHPLPCPSSFAAPKTLSPTPSLGGRLWDSCLRFDIACEGILVTKRKSSTVYPFSTFSCFYLHLACTVLGIIRVPDIYPPTHESALTEACHLYLCNCMHANLYSYS